MARRADRFVSGLVLAGEAAQRPGSRHARLLRRVLDTARSCRFDQLLIAVGGAGAAAAASAGLDLAGADVLADAPHREGWASSIVEALANLDPRTDVLVLMLGDQAGMTPGTVQSLLDGMGLAALAACGYASGRGHPLAIRREAFGELSGLDGDAGVWDLLERHPDGVVDVPVAGARTPAVQAARA
ncbi:MAG TPA: NTP transferase domain-containing protein [Solirubrobacteraceae bacterium]|nr:NTP transferase domain-containing protein [Solirubrobacteraceae bacterium]